MRFDAEHRFHGSVEAVAAVLADPRFYTGLDLPDVARPVLLDHKKEAQRSVAVLRYEFIGSLDPMARRLLGRHRLAWTQEISVDRAAGSGELTFRAEVEPKRLHGSAEFRLIAEGDSTVRRLSGELVIAVPVIGPSAERRIVPGLLRRLDVEADAVEATLKGAAGNDRR
jgi:hypothetical protein